MPETDFAIEYRDPQGLKNHPLSIQLYGDEPGEQFVESVRRHGIVEPLQVLPDDTVIGGHRRKQAARINGLKQVPVIVRSDLTDPLDVEEFVILANVYRQKTNEQKAREYEKLKEIEQQRAKRRQATSTGGASPQLQENLPEADKGQSRDKAAQRLGWSGRTAEKAAAVAGEIDAAESSGDTKRADALRGALNRSVDGAYRERPSSGRASPREPTPLRLVEKRIEAAFGKLIRAVDERARNQGALHSAGHEACLNALSKFLDALRKWREDERSNGVADRPF